jgi:signal transduction histidine kinase
VITAPRRSVPSTALEGTDADALVGAARELAAARSVAEVTSAVRQRARQLLGADGVTFVLREGDLVHYVDEDAIAPLWKGRRFPASACISGWAMVHRTAVMIDDVFADPRIPHDLYAPTFVKALLMVPVRPEDPVAAIGAYWARAHRASARELQLLEAIAGLAAVALANAALYADLRDAVAARDAFIGIASHELRTPLAAVRLQVDRAIRNAARGTDGVLQSGLMRARSTVDRLSRLVDTLLDASRIAQGRIALAPERFDLREVAAAVVDRAHDLGGAPVTLADGPPLRGRWDRDRMEQVLDNLVSNAVKFGDGKPVEVSLAAADGDARVTVRDHGIGIPAEAQERIFDRFERAVSARSFGGFGLGLWIVREVVAAHGGRVDVRSQPGEGATFTVALPREPP